jgi:hypothetical protein
MKEELAARRKTQLHRRIGFKGWIAKWDGGIFWVQSRWRAPWQQQHDDH